MININVAQPADGALMGCPRSNVDCFEEIIWPWVTID
jgi:hypothetical protein